ncbi:N-acyltransferase YncA [Stieleria maiorica]|uniref:N-acyltransferase YncA n=1 Tax=Stieleria maiorica TaxID=2795974 RepID=A0A5B9MC77_9BACT|nr:GNAT family N-acetyltransferase [Stieleria maiorica]QEF97214.1 N-acyltransferase YncA [Stieleria maiorica]
MIRLANESDAARISEIYNHYVRTSTCTFHLDPESVDDRLDWLRAHDDRHPVTVFCVSGEVVGWASLTRWHPRPAYSETAEVSFYLDHRWHRRGIGRTLLTDLIDRASSLGFHVLIGGACTEHVASMELQKSLGFREVARFTEVGRKFDRWLDVAYFQLTLNQ